MIIKKFDISSWSVCLVIATEVGTVGEALERSYGNNGALDGGVPNVACRI